MMCRAARAALIAGLLSPVTSAAILLALARFTTLGTPLPPDVETIGTLAFFMIVMLYAVLFTALPAALFAGIGISVLVTLRARGLSPPALLPLGAVLGAGCGLLLGGFGGGIKPQNPYAVAGALNGALWGLLVAYYALRDRRGS